MSVTFTLISHARGIVKIFVHQAWSQGTVADRKRIFAQAFKRSGECLHVSDLTRHQELKRVLGSGVIAEVDQPFVDYFRPSFGSDIAAEINMRDITRYL
jgi:hypothetical protein